MQRLLAHVSAPMRIGIHPPFSPEERACADELPAFGGMQFVGQFSWAGPKYLIYERRE